MWAMPEARGHRGAEDSVEKARCTAFSGKTFTLKPSTSLCVSVCTTPAFSRRMVQKSNAMCPAVGAPHCGRQRSGPGCSLLAPQQGLEGSGHPRKSTSLDGGPFRPPYMSRSVRGSQTRILVHNILLPSLKAFWGARWLPVLVGQGPAAHPTPSSYYITIL